MQLREFFQPDAIALDLRGADKDAVLAELVGLLGMGDRNGDTLLRVLHRRESLGSTGIGAGIAIPHAQVAALDQFFCLFARLDRPIDYGAIDGRPVDLEHFQNESA